ncbi:MAG: radical SAM protein [Lachnospiraceae bacterium]|nr:radical SAM protein [Lachnospiraceae bacterium]
MSETFDIQEYLTNGVKDLIKDVLKATLKNPREAAFMAKFAAATTAATKRREANESAGLHVPSYLIASITSNCNLHCAGCYSRVNRATEDCEPVAQLTGEQWGSIFDEADDLGISFILLAGGEPTLRKDVIEEAAKRKNILFPIFTNGTFLNERYFDLMDQNRNLVPIVSLEGGFETTEARRGAGIYQKLIKNMEELKKRGIIFGTSITVTTENLEEVLSDSFVEDLGEKGCRAMILVEFVPVTDEASHLAPGDAERARMNEKIMALREKYPEMVFISFPGDEKSSGGCLAAGRGFFHINSHGGAEPCPFSPFSDINVIETSLKDAISSKLFVTLRENGHLLENHAGGCVLYEKRELVAQLVGQMSDQ